MGNIKFLAKLNLDGFRRGIVYLGERTEEISKLYSMEGYTITGDEGGQYFFDQRNFSSYFEIVPEDYEPPKFIDLKGIPTYQLVEELTTREGVPTVVQVEPHIEYELYSDKELEVTDTGPATIIVVID